MGRAITGTFTSNGAAKFLELGFSPDMIRVINYTKTAAGAGVAKSEWFKGMAADSAIQTTQASSTTTVVNADGFIPKDGSVALNVSYSKLTNPANDAQEYFRTAGAPGTQNYAPNDPVVISGTGRGMMLGTAVVGANNDVIFYEAIIND